VPSSEKLPHLLFRLWEHFSPRRKGQFALLLILMVLVSFAEVLSLGAIVPFLAALTNPKQIFELPIAQPFIQLLGIQSEGELLLPLTLLFGFTAIVAGAMRLVLLKVSLRLSFATGADIGYSIYRKTLYQPYLTHLSRNTSEIIDGVTGKTTIVTDGIIMSALYVLSSMIMLVLMLGTLLVIAPIPSAAAFGVFGLMYFITMKVTRRKLMNNSKDITVESARVIKSLQEGLGGIRDILIDGSQDAYCQVYQKSDSILRKAYATSSFISVSPRFVTEALGMLLIALLAFVLTKQSNEINQAIPIVGALALASQRLLPVMQLAYSAWTAILRNQFSLKDTLDFLDQPLPEYANQLPSNPIPFNKEINLKDVSFQYRENSPLILDKLSLTIPKGSRVGFIGTTGAGKSTLLDILMGLLRPSSGALEIDNQVITEANHRAWQMHIAHVPQTIYLADSTIEENIAFGIPKHEIDHERVKRVAEQAQIAKTIEGLPQGYETFVGERGTRLSGGQRQRIGIARALYKNADVLIFDEATSALDTETEIAVMESIQNLGSHYTVLMIAHRLSTLKDCSMLVKLDHGKIEAIGSYEDLALPIIESK
jgi:ATP-binding cassette subfamily B protein